MNNHKPFGPYERFIKRPMDFCLSAFALAILSPIMGITAALVRVKLGSPVFFVQERIGKNEKAFNMYKFRSMTEERDKNGNLLPDELRVNKFSQFLRSTSLDELPELFNILKGDMSVVGPRPLLSSYLPFYTDEEKHRHDVRPGLTGLAQVKGRNFLTWEEIFDFDLEYVHHCSFGLDVAIVWQTVKKVITRGEIADVQTTTIDEDGTTWVVYNGEKKRLHRPLNEERASC